MENVSKEYWDDMKCGREHKSEVLDKYINQWIAIVDKKVGSGKISESEPHKLIARAAEDIGKLLTRERIRLLHAIRENKPESISELARILNRKESNVHSDLTFLKGIGLLELKESNDHVNCQSC